MNSAKPVVAEDATALAEILGLTPIDGAEIQLRSDLNDKIIEVVEKSGLTHVQVAKLARTSRSRMTAILNRNTQDVSTDLMLRIMASFRLSGQTDLLTSGVADFVSPPNPRRACQRGIEVEQKGRDRGW